MIYSAQTTSCSQGHEHLKHLGESSANVLGKFSQWRNATLSHVIAKYKGGYFKSTLYFDLSSSYFDFNVAEHQHC